jgi:CheY-like chemotaxis protein
VYALTAYAMLSDKDIIEKNGFDGLFTKPINTVQLQRKLTNIFKTAI